MVEPITMAVLGGAAKVAAVAGAEATAGTAVGTGLAVGAGGTLAVGTAAAGTSIATLAAEGTASVTAAAKATETLGGLAAGPGAITGATTSFSTRAFVDTMATSPPGVEVASSSQLGAHVRDQLAHSASPGLGGPALGPAEQAGRTAPRFDLDAWKAWKPQAGEVIKPPAVAERFRALQNVDNLTAHANDLLKQDSSFGREMSRLGDQYRTAQIADQDAIFSQVRKGPAGRLAESVVSDAIRPLYRDVGTYAHVQTPNGASYIDIRCIDARNPIVWGRGHGVAPGGNCSIEVKTGRAGYLTSQVPHITERQVPGHLAMGDGSLVVVSRDVYAMAGERLARDSVKGAGSYVMALLPEKAVIDEVMRRVLAAQAGIGP